MLYGIRLTSRTNPIWLGYRIARSHVVATTRSRALKFWTRGAAERYLAAQGGKGEFATAKVEYLWTLF